MDDILAKAKYWLSDVFDADTRKKTEDLIKNDEDGLRESFYQDLAFGTGGMRGIMGVGTNRINKYTLGKNTQGLSNYLKEKFPGEEIRVAIAHDCRNNSKELARVVANVFSANGIHVYLFSDLRPTPELSFAVRTLKCQSGIVLTASHNPPEYNGYKVYWSDGGQLVPPHDEAVVDTISKLSYEEIKFEANNDLITEIDEEIDRAFLEESVKHTSFGNTPEDKDNLTIVFTSLHGTSITLVPRVLEKAGFKNVHLVEEQAEPNGDFPTVESPNPEEPAALKMAMELAEKTGADIALGTDPDTDRLGIVTRDTEGKLVILNGNQILILLTDFLLQKFKEKGFKGNEFVATTVVSTDMVEALADAYGVECKLGLTGFKWIAKMIKDAPDQKFIGGGEESYGYMVGDFVRDKDAVTSVLLACEVAAAAKAKGSSLYEELLRAYEEHGVYQERTISLVKKGIEGAEEIKAIMANLRKDPPTAFQGIAVNTMDDFETSKTTDITTGKQKELDYPKSNVLIFHLEDGSKIAARPSGTEPKIKFYVGVKGEMDSREEYAKVQAELNKKIDDLLTEFDA